ncbi:MAG: hypothetical protein ACYC7E_08930 [Armatimonadota bacterium]
MRLLLMLLLVAALGGGVALAQVTTTTTTTVVTSDVTTQTCPAAYVAPQPCPVLVTTTPGGRAMVLVLGTREDAAFDLAPAHNVGYSNTVSGSPSLFTPGNPLMYHRVNNVVSRHGNAYFPYYALPSGSRIAGTTEIFTGGRAPWPRTLSSLGRNQLQGVYEQYRTLTPQQARAMGYQPLPQCVPGLGVVYLNTGMAGATFDRSRPAAFTFTSDGRLLSVHYIVQTTQAPTVYGMRLEPSPLVQGSWQLPVWLYENNPNGMFSLMNPRVTCVPATTATTGTM